MYQKAESIYYGLATFVLGTALFVMQPSNLPDVAAWQQTVKQQIGTAIVQTFGDGPWFQEVGFIYDSTSAFYQKAASVTITMFDDPEANEDIAFVYTQVYKIFANALNTSTNHGFAYNDVQLPAIGPDFMTQEPIYNIVPYKEVVTTIDDKLTALGSVAGESVSIDKPVNSISMPWVTIRDNSTGQLYCLAVYNGTVNQYLGPCKYDGYH